MTQPVRVKDESRHDYDYFSDYWNETSEIKGGGEECVPTVNWLCFQYTHCNTLKKNKSDTKMPVVKAKRMRSL